MNPSSPCPCGSGIALSLCCGRWHAGEPATHAEALMRSRYTAFVVGDEPYLLATWHVSTRPASVPFDSKQKWLGLEIVATKVVDTNAAEVEFIARYRIGGGSAARHHERSHFIRDAGRWFYVDGDLVLQR